MSQQLKQHPLSAAFPSMPEADWAALAEDIRVNGLAHPVVLFEGRVLDGWHRFTACEHAGVRLRTVEYEGKDPAAYVLSANLSRRHLTATQRATAVLECEQWRGSGRNSAHVRSKTAAELATIADVSPRTIENAKAGIRAGNGEAMKSGEISARAAAAPPAEPKVIDGEEEGRPPDDYTEEDQRAEHAADFEAMTRIIDADDKLSAAVGELRVVRETMATMSHLYDDKSREVATMTKEAARWMRKAKKSAACQNCMTALERE